MASAQSDIPGVVTLAECQGPTSEAIRTSARAALAKLKTILPALVEAAADQNLACFPQLAAYAEDGREQKTTTSMYIDQSHAADTIRNVERAWNTGDIRRPTLKERWAIEGEPGFLVSHSSSLTWAKTYDGYGAAWVQAKPLLVAQGAGETAVLLGCEYLDGTAFTVAVRLAGSGTELRLYPGRDIFDSHHVWSAAVERSAMVACLDHLIGNETVAYFSVPFASLPSLVQELGDRHRHELTDELRIEVATAFFRFMEAAAMSPTPGDLPHDLFFLNPDPQAFSGDAFRALPVVSIVASTKADVPGHLTEASEAVG